MNTLIAYKKIILKRAIAERPAKIGAVTGTHAYHHFESLLLSPRTALGKIACKRRGPRSRAGLRPGPVGPPNAATSAKTKKPKAIWATALAILKDEAAAQPRDALAVVERLAGERRPVAMAPH